MAMAAMSRLVAIGRRMKPSEMFTGDAPYETEDGEDASDGIFRVFTSDARYV